MTQEDNFISVTLDHEIAEGLRLEGKSDSYKGRRLDATVKFTGSITIHGDDVLPFVNAIRKVVEVYKL
jgi:hypothetical protein